jgi:hypothetical protein
MHLHGLKNITKNSNYLSFYRIKSFMKDVMSDLFHLLPAMYIKFTLTDKS